MAVVGIVADRVEAAVDKYMGVDRFELGAVQRKEVVGSGKIDVVGVEVVPVVHSVTEFVGESFPV